MDKNKMMGLLSEAAREIEGLRRENQYLNGQMEVVRIFGRCAGPPDCGSKQASPDVLWGIREAINEIGHSFAVGEPA